MKKPQDVSRIDTEIMEWERELAELSERMGYRFQDLSYLKQALTHKSFAHEVTAREKRTKRKDPGSSLPSDFPDNEKMEFLGDSLLGMIISEHLYRSYPGYQEGKLSRLKSVVVSESVIARKARALGLGVMLRLGKGEKASGGEKRSSLLGDSLEALIAAVYLDGGLEACREFVRREFQDEIERVVHDRHEKDYKSLLQEAVQSRHHKIPVYRVRRTSGPDHQRTFEVTVSIKGETQGVGRGKSKKEAEQKAAREAFRTL